MSVSRFTFRPGGTSEVDIEAIMKAFDSTLIHLEKTGNGEQWGTKSTAEREGYANGVKEDLEISEAWRMRGEGESKLVIMAELLDTSDAKDGLTRRVADDGTLWIQVGNMEMYENCLSDHVADHPDLQPYVDEVKSTPGGFLYINFLTSDFRAGNLSKGVGEAMIRYALGYAKERGMGALYLDAWIGGTRKLLEYVCPCVRAGFKC